jgi:hypothetical protein
MSAIAPQLGHKQTRVEKQIKDWCLTKAGTAPSTIRSPSPVAAICATLRDAGNYISKLPEREHDAPASLAAIQALSWSSNTAVTPCCPGSQWYGPLNVGKPLNISAVERLPRNTR